MPNHACDILSTDRPASCTLVIFGGSGDLTRRKLIPALYSLYRQNRLPEPFVIVGCSRTIMTDDQYRDKLKAGYENIGLDLSDWDAFSSLLNYYPLTYDLESFSGLREYLVHLDQVNHCQGNRIFDLAVPPSLYPIIADLLGRASLSEQRNRNNAWTRIVVEKPFGRDLESALALDRILHASFKEEQIFRIDHYLAKETVQNMLIFRFANSIFEPIWNRHHIEYVGIIAAESMGVGSRAGYYEQAGVLRDMFQNHMMQLLVLTAMEPPCRLEAGSVQDEKIKVIRSLRDFHPDQGSRICLGQYGRGTIDGVDVTGYRQEPGVDPHSLVPTFALMELYVDNWRWQDVPFFLVSGKRLPQKKTRIIIQFKEVPHRLFKDVLGETIGANRLIIEIFPEEAIRLTFQTKNPGASICLRSMTMDFTYNEHYQGEPLEAYARVLLDCMNGDHMLFWRQDGIELSWSVLTPILQECEQCCNRDQQLHIYPAGSWGPEAADSRFQKLIHTP
jgi:glucose-6-phosphate 1-dehydrogenase